MAIDLNAYFLRIGYTGERAPTLETLRAINRRHPQAIPFENLNALMKWPAPLDASRNWFAMVEGRFGMPGIDVDDG